MSSKARAEERMHVRGEIVGHWGREHSVNVERLDDGQKWIVFVTLQVLAWIGNISPLKRLLGCFLSHCGMGLSGALIGTLLGCSDRNARYNKEYSAEELWQRISRPERGHAAAKLGPEHAGSVAKYLVEHPGARVDDILAFIARELEVDIGPLTLRRYIKRYGLGCLRDQKHEQSPLFWERASTEAPLS